MRCRLHKAGCVALLLLPPRALAPNTISLSLSLSAHATRRTYDAHGAGVLNDGRYRAGSAKLQEVRAAVSFWGGFELDKKQEAWME